MRAARGSARNRGIGSLQRAPVPARPDRGKPEDRPQSDRSSDYTPLRLPWATALTAALMARWQASYMAKKVAAIHHLSRHTESTSALGNPAVGLGAFGEFSVAIILVHKNHR